MKTVESEGSTSVISAFVHPRRVIRERDMLQPSGVIDKAGFQGDSLALPCHCGCVRTGASDRYQGPLRAQPPTAWAGGALDPCEPSLVWKEEGEGRL